MTKAKHAKDAFSGEGARLAGGRWNSRGNAVVYTASSASLAVLERLVHLESDEILEAYLLCEVSFSDELVKSVNAADLAPDWRAASPPPELQRIGDTWLASRSCAVLRVPSVIVELEFNYLLNPAHPNFGRIDIGPFLPYRLDPRLRK
jgi:RES domain-containing protein